jgi:hypothetical protein
MRFELFRVQSIFEFFRLLDLSLSPKVVGALAPTVKCSFHGAILALGVAEGSDSAGSFSQPSFLK